MFVVQLVAPAGLVLVAALLYTGCFSDRREPVDAAPLAVYDDAGVSRAIRAHFDRTLGQIIAVDNTTAVTASAIVSVTSPKPDLAKVWLVKEEGAWVVSRVQRNYSSNDEE